MMNAVHDLSVLVARDEGLFRDEGLDVEVIDTVGTARANPVGETLHWPIWPAHEQIASTRDAHLGKRPGGRPQSAGRTGP